MLYIGRWITPTLLVAVMSFGVQVQLAHATTCDAGNPVGSQCIVILNTGAGSGNQTWTVPADWNNSSNSVAIIGSGGKGGLSNANGGGGGGGGAYASSTNLTLSGTVTYAIGTSSTTTAPTLGQSGLYETYFNGTASSTASVTADWGRMGNSSAGGAGGSTAYSIGSVKFAGGNGGAPGGATNSGGGGGGGSGGPEGAGPSAASDSGFSSAGGGSGNGGGSAGSSGGASLNKGGNNYLGSGGGTASGGNGSNGGGGGGAASGASSTSGGNGSAGNEWGTGIGSGGGGGGAAPSGSGSFGGAGGKYGGGGGGGQDAGLGGPGIGGQGLIVIIYTPTSSSSHAVSQNISYTYDADGNITQVIDNSSSDAAATTTYTYDGLNRLLTASTTGIAIGNNFFKTWTYDALGNISSSTDKGVYSYAGNSGSSYADPDAATSIGTSTTLAYDHNGNLLTFKVGTTATSSFAWDYVNRLTQSIVAGATTTYGYDVNNERVFAGSTYYPFTFYNTQGSTSTIVKHIFINGEPVADIQGSGTSSASIYYIHGDQLNSTNVVSNSSANADQLYAYYPFGAARVSEKNGSFTEQRQYIGDEFDSNSNLNYLNNRYYNSGQGQFISQDPIFTGPASQQNLQDPQSLNAYSYSEDNPIVRSDPTGKLTASGLFKDINGAISNLLYAVGLYDPLANGYTPVGPSSQKSAAGGSVGQSTFHVGNSSIGAVIPTTAWQTQLPDMTACFKTCEKMAGYTPSRSDGIITSNLANGNLVTQPAAKQGVATINSYLEAGKPIIVGVNRDGGTEEGNLNPASQHYVVIVGESADQNGQYYTFYDPGTSREAAGTSALNRLYLNPVDNTLSGTSVYNGATYTVTEVRPQ